MSDLSTYVKKAKESKSDLQEVMERRKSKKLQELEEAEIDAYIAEAKDKIRKTAPEKLDSTQTTNFAAMLFAGRKPEEIKQILSTLTQEEIDRLAYIASSMTPNGLTNFRGFLREPTTSMKDAVEAIKVGVELSKKPDTSGAVDLKGIAEIFKAGVEAAKVQNPAQPQQNVYETLVKSTLDELKATREQMASQDRMRIEKEIAELKARPSGIDDLLYNEEKAARARKMFGGTDSATANEYSLKKEDMQQKERLETRKLDIEEKRWEYEKANEGKTIEQIKDVAKILGEGPIGRVIENIGGAGADRLRGSAKSNSGRVVQVKCPACKGVFPANEQLASLTCPLCGTGLERGKQPAPQEPPTQATQSPEKTQESQAQTEQPPAEGQGSAEPASQ